MNLVEIVRSIEGLIFEVATWFVMVPKTLYKVVTSPNWIPAYVARELSKPREERFDEYTSPIILWLLLTVFPYLWGAKLVGTSLTGGFEQETLIIALFLSAGPIGFATGLVAAKKQELSKSSLEEAFYIQCYCFTPTYILMFPAVILTLGNLLQSTSSSRPLIFWTSLSVGLLWLLISEVFAIRHQLRSTLVRSILLFFPLFFASYMLWWAIVAMLLIGQYVTGLIA